MADSTGSMTVAQLRQWLLNFSDDAVVRASVAVFAGRATICSEISGTSVYADRSSDYKLTLPLLEVEGQ